MVCIVTFDKLGDLFRVSILSTVGKESDLTGLGMDGSWFAFLLLRCGGGCYAILKESLISVFFIGYFRDVGCNSFSCFSSLVVVQTCN